MYLGQISLRMCSCSSSPFCVLGSCLYAAILVQTDSYIDFAFYNGSIFAVTQSHQSKVQAQPECLRRRIQNSYACTACSRSTNVGHECQIGSRVGTAPKTSHTRTPCVTGKALVPTYLQWVQATGAAEPEDKVSIAYIGKAHLLSKYQ